MSTNKPIIRAILVSVLVLTFGLPYLIPHSEAVAQNAGTEDYVVQAGSYELLVKSAPSQISLGTVSYEILIINSDNAEPVKDARVNINLIHATNGDEGWASALHQPGAPGTYLATVQVEKSGIWLSSVDVSSDLGRVEIDTPQVLVPESRTTIAGSLVFLGAFLFIILGTFYVIWSSKKAVRRRGTGSEN